MVSSTSIAVMKDSYRRNKLRAYINHKAKLKERCEINRIKSTNYKNRNSVVLTNAGIEHEYAKFVVALAIYKSDKDVITEFAVDGGEVDDFSIDQNLFVEIQKNTSQDIIKKKLEQYRGFIESGLIYDVIILGLDEFTYDLHKDIEMVKKRLGL